MLVTRQPGNSNCFVSLSQIAIVTRMTWNNLFSGDEEGSQAKPTHGFPRAGDTTKGIKFKHREPPKNDAWKTHVFFQDLEKPGTAPIIFKNFEQLVTPA